MIFGDKSSFALEINFDSEIDEWTFGKVKYSIINTQIGGGNTSLRDFYLLIPPIIKLAKERADDRRFIMNSRECFY
jgi:hypothetical protein